MDRVSEIINQYELYHHKPLPIPRGPSSIPELVESGFNKIGNKTAILQGNRPVTYKQLQSLAYKNANALLKMGVEKGDRVAVSMPNSTDIIELFLGTMLTGAIWVGVNMKLSLAEKMKLLEETKSKIFVADRKTISGLEEKKEFIDHSINMVPYDDEKSPNNWLGEVTNSPSDRSDVKIDPYAPASIAYTSGSTGRPKGAVHSQHNMLLCAKMIRQKHLSGTVIGNILPMTILNIMIHGPLCAFVDGAVISIFKDISSAEIVRQVREKKVASFGGFVPALVYDLIKDDDVKKEDLNNLLQAGAGGASCTDELKEAYESKFNRRLHSAYGLTEAPGAVVVELKNKPAVKGATGEPLPHIQIYIFDEEGNPVSAGTPGEICIGPQTEGEYSGVYSPMLGYWNNMELTKKVLKGNVLHTGDVGKMDDKGNLYVLERKDEMIIRGGNNIYPAEIEDVLMQHPEIEGCAVFGKPHARQGQTIVGCIQKIKGSTLDKAEVEVYLSERLAKYKIPESIIFMPNLPKNAMGKIMKEEVKREVTKKLAD